MFVRGFVCCLLIAAGRLFARCLHFLYVDCCVAFVDGCLLYADVVR